MVTLALVSPARLHWGRAASATASVVVNAVRQKVTALFPADEVERFTELFWERIQAWRAAGGP